MSEVDDLRCPDCGAVEWFAQINEAMPSTFDPGEVSFYTRRIRVSRRQDGRLDVEQTFDDIGDHVGIVMGELDISCLECNESNSPDRISDIVDAALAHFGKGEEGEYVV